MAGHHAEDDGVAGAGAVHALGAVEAARHLAGGVEARDELLVLVEHTGGLVDEHAAHEVVRAHAELVAVQRRVQRGGVLAPEGRVGARGGVGVPQGDGVGQVVAVEAQLIAERLGGVGLLDIALLGQALHALVVVVGVEDGEHLALVLSQDLGGHLELLGTEALPGVVHIDGAVHAEAARGERHAVALDDRGEGLDLVEVHGLRAQLLRHEEAVAGGGGHLVGDAVGIRRGNLRDELLVLAEAARGENNGRRAEGHLATLLVGGRYAAHGAVGVLHQPLSCHVEVHGDTRLVDGRAQGRHHV